MSGREGGSEAGPCDGGVAETQQLLCSIQDRDVSVSSPPPVPSERLLTLAVAEFLGTTFLVYFGACVYVCVCVDAQHVHVPA